MTERRRFNFDNTCSLIWIRENEQEKVLIKCNDSDEVEILIETEKYFTAKKIFDKNALFINALAKIESAEWLEEGADAAESATAFDR